MGPRFSSWRPSRKTMFFTTKPQGSGMPLRKPNRVDHCDGSRVGNKARHHGGKRNKKIVLNAREFKDWTMVAIFRRISDKSRLANSGVTIVSAARDEIASCTCPVPNDESGHRAASALTLLNKKPLRPVSFPAVPC